MALTIPVSTNYQNIASPIPSRMQDEPVNGRMQIPLEFLWASMGGTTKTVAVNLQDNNTLAFDQVSTLKVDNSKCGADVTFIFPDTGETIAIEAGTPLAIIPVLSNSKQFYVSAPNAISIDITRAQILNYPVNPVTLGDARNQQVAAPGLRELDLTPNFEIQIVGTSISGTLTDLSLEVSWNNSGGAPPSGDAYEYELRFYDKTFATKTFQFTGVAAGYDDQNLNVQVWNFSGINQRFQNGLILRSDFITSGVPAGIGMAALNAFYIIP